MVILRERLISHVAIVISMVTGRFQDMEFGLNLYFKISKGAGKRYQVLTDAD